MCSARSRFQSLAPPPATTDRAPKPRPSRELRPFRSPPSPRRLIPTLRVPISPGFKVAPARPVWVIEVSDFQCPYCKQWHDQTYAAFRDQYVNTGKVRLAYVNFPLASHVHAWPAAESAMCAGAQGKFWQMHDALFTTQNRWEAMSSPTAMFDSLAQANGLDMKRWRNCVSSGEMKPLIEADHDRASKAGAEATPSFMIGNKILTGAQSLDELRNAIDSALVKAKKTTR